MTILKNERVDLQSHARWFGEDSAFSLFKRMTNDSSNLEHSYSWFRDQVLHPHETQHTLEELFNWVEEEGLTIQSTSINKYKPLKSFNKAELINMEKCLETYSYKKNVQELKFNPGYFTICAKKI